MLESSHKSTKSPNGESAAAARQAPGDFLFVPDLWQQDAVRALLAKQDVIVQAPTGAGKTLVFEQWLEQSKGGQAIFTVPTRALANDKFQSWRERGWRVGITTGDIVIDADAPLRVATLETCKRALMEGNGPDMLVIDEYQMLADPARGVHYETALACAPPQTQVLLLSGSVANPHQVAEWLRRLGRKVTLIECVERPVPLEEVPLEALPDRVPNHIQGRLPRMLARALMADLGPILVFAPKRRAAEVLAQKLAGMFAASDFLALTPAQKQLADSQLARLLRHRVAFHHSGLSYAQRVGLIEPLARAGQLKVIVATTGLAAGINFSVRSVLVLDREYRAGGESARIRADELLQMFGRAGRRGIDARGSVLYADRHARLAEARPIVLKRSAKVDWSNLLTVMHSAAQRGEDPVVAARAMAARLFADERILLGFDALKQGALTTADATAAAVNNQAPSLSALASQLAGGSVVEFLNSKGIWERRPAPRRVRFGESWHRREDDWQAASASPTAIAHFRIGTSCCLTKGKSAERRYGRELALALFPQKTNQPGLRLTQWLRGCLRAAAQQRGERKAVPKSLSLEAIEKDILPLLPALTGGGECSEWIERKGTLFARLDFSNAPILAFVDREGQALLNPRLRRRLTGQAPSHKGMLDQPATPASSRATIAATWLALGLIHRAGIPTRRGVITSFFQQGEGLAIAACLEDPSYDPEALLNDLITLRAGHRFAGVDAGGCRIGGLCRMRYGHCHIAGLLRDGVPEDYGDGAAAILQPGFSLEQLRRNHADVEIRSGDIERTRLEWQSLRYQIAAAPDYPWSRWQDLREAAKASLPKKRSAFALDNIPPLTRAQRKRHPTLHWL